MGDEGKISPDGPSLGNRLGDIWDNPVEGLTDKKDGKGVFDKFSKTITGKNMYEVDKAEKDFKLLDPANMATKMANEGMKPGVHHHTVRGDSVYHYLKNRTRLIDGNEFLVVKQQQLEEIIGDSLLTYDANRTVVVGDTDDLSVKKSQSIFVLGPSSEQYVGKHEVTAPEDFEWKQLESGFTATSVDLKGIDMAITAASGEFNILETTVEGVAAFLKGFHEGANGHEGKAIALRDEAIPMEPVLIVRVNILVQVCIITPFG
jgi:hypothetical protein